MNSTAFCDKQFFLLTITQSLLKRIPLNAVSLMLLISTFDNNQITSIKTDPYVWAKGYQPCGGALEDWEANQRKVGQVSFTRLEDDILDRNALGGLAG